MTNKKETLSVSLSKLVLAVSIIVCIGALFGAVGYLMSHPQQIIIPIINPKNDERCNQKAKVSETCSAVGFEFNLNEGKCVVVNGAGCIDNLPFGALEECQTICEEKTAQDQDVSVVLDKTEYEKGETINGLINFKKDIYINPNIRIYKFNNNNLEYLGEWSFDGTQYTCCGAMPNCEANFVKNSPVKFIWDQKIVKEELPILPGNPITKIQIASGKYKISVIYGDQPVCIDGINMEFTIK